ncbi:hypothetical protein GCM10010911_06940 [Paenibacillus nasutitermitis]|uniref:Uncharacterized protein n=1 Tax=Paenibacillus nasutitermitis TaxID=1652958 RepID=A0A917DM89_9BACL|nr:hypothetical protein GCM10010911_06940 [Paenibacillus nasutitermitis]
MGHDPAPCITYNNLQVFVWPDDPEAIGRNTNNCIQYSYPELLESLDETRKDVQSFIEGPLFNWIERKDSEIANTMRDKMKKWITKT